jgi:hypothetical protein
MFCRRYYCSLPENLRCNTFHRLIDNNTKVHCVLLTIHTGLLRSHHIYHWSNDLFFLFSFWTKKTLITESRENTMMFRLLLIKMVIMMMAMKIPSTMSFAQPTRLFTTSSSLLSLPRTTTFLYSMKDSIGYNNNNNKLDRNVLLVGVVGRQDDGVESGQTSVTLPQKRMDIPTKYITLERLFGFGFCYCYCYCSLYVRRNKKKL